MKMKDFVITQKNLIKFLQGLIKKTNVIAPLKNEFGDVLLLPVDSVNEICLDYENTINSAKEYLFPDSECMFTFQERKAGFIQLPDLKEDFILFGLRACDTQAINLLDNFFRRDFEDDFYLQRRAASTLITLVCPRIWEECFCTSVGSGPLLEAGFDIQLIPLEGRYFVQGASEKGLLLLKEFRKFFKPADDEDKKEISKFPEKIEAKEKRFDLDKIYKNLKENKISSIFWQDIASRCQSCGLCLFICPTCSCFTVNDREKATSLPARVRQWDGCYFRGFTRMANDQDPVASGEEMVKRKYLHKLWQQIDEFGMAGCTGCGRCNKVCVGNVDWQENLIRIEKGLIDNV